MEVYEYEVGRTCRIEGKMKMHENDSCKTRDLGIDGNIILKLIMKKQVAKM
jgi:hypothetical protein